MSCGFKLLPMPNKKTLHLGGNVVIDCVEFVSNMQGICIWFAFASKLVCDSGKDMSLGSCLLELSWAEKVATQGGVLGGITILLELSGYSICNGGLARAGLTSQPEDAWAGWWAIISLFGDVFQYLEACSGCTLFMLQALLFKNGLVVSLLRGTQVF